MKTVIITHEVKNYSVWRKAYDADASNRSKAGFHPTGEYQSVSNPNIVTVIVEAPSLEAVNAFMSNPELKASMEQGGVIGIPDVKILNNLLQHEQEHLKAEPAM